MPAPVIHSLAVKSGKSDEEVETQWNKAKAQVAKEYPNLSTTSDKHWALVTGITKKMVGITEETQMADTKSLKDVHPNAFHIDRDAGAGYYDNPDLFDKDATAAGAEVVDNGNGTHSANIDGTEIGKYHSAPVHGMEKGYGKLAVPVDSIPAGAAPSTSGDNNVMVMAPPDGPVDSGSSALAVGATVGEAVEAPASTESIPAPAGVNTDASAESPHDDDSSPVGDMPVDKGGIAPAVHNSTVESVDFITLVTEELAAVGDTAVVMQPFNHADYVDMIGDLTDASSDEVVSSWNAACQAVQQAYPDLDPNSDEFNALVAMEVLAVFDDLSGDQGDDSTNVASSADSNADANGSPSPVVTTNEGVYKKMAGGAAVGAGAGAALGSVGGPAGAAVGAATGAVYGAAIGAVTDAIAALHRHEEAEKDPQKQAKIQAEIAKKQQRLTVLKAKQQAHRATQKNEAVEAPVIAKSVPAPGDVADDTAAEAPKLVEPNQLPQYKNGTLVLAPAVKEALFGGKAAAAGNEQGEDEADNAEDANDAALDDEHDPSVSVGEAVEAPAIAQSTPAPSNVADAPNNEAPKYHDNDDDAPGDTNNDPQYKGGTLVTAPAVKEAAGDKWSDKVTADATSHPKADLYATGSAKDIAASEKSREGSAGDAIKAITFYKNRAGKNLSSERVATINAAIAILQKQDAKKESYIPEAASNAQKAKTAKIHDAIKKLTALRIQRKNAVKAHQPHAVIDDELAAQKARIKALRA